ncbi:MAG: hypothetical protein O3C28_03420 [Proteobacteria bacterium]|nr:hypothetical protein [Pseudomonadota bacterium]
MKIPRHLVTTLTIAGVALCVMLYWTQTTGVQIICDSFPIGSVVEDSEQLANSFGVQLKGPFDLIDKPGIKHYTYCAQFTLCKMSCEMEMSGTVVAHSVLNK